MVAGPPISQHSLQKIISGKPCNHLRRRWAKKFQTTLRKPCRNMINILARGCKRTKRINLGPKKGCTTGFALFQQDEYKQLTAASDSDISAADVQRKIAAKWKNNLSWQERMLWDDKAATLNKQVLEGARDARGGSSAASGNEWLIRPVPLLHSDKYILTEDQYQKVR